MRNKTMIITLITLIVLTGCQARLSARETLSATMQTMRQIERVTNNITIEGTFTASDALLSQLKVSPASLDGFNRGQLFIALRQDIVNQRFNSDITVQFGSLPFGIAISQHDDATLAIKTPISEKYATITLNEAQRAHLMTADELRQLQANIDRLILDQTTDEQMHIVYDQPQEDGDGQALTMITIDYTGEHLRKLSDSILSELLNHPKISASIDSAIQTQLSIAKPNLDADALPSAMTALRRDITEQLSAIGQRITLNGLTATLAINDVNQLVDSQYRFAFDYKDKDQQFTADLSIDNKYLALDAPYQAPAINLNDDNSIPLEKLIMQILFSGSIIQ